MIWIIGGTKDSRDIMEKVIAVSKEGIIISTATKYGGELLKEYKNANNGREIIIMSEKLDESEIESLIKEKGVNLVIDASHPYAQNISKIAIDVTGRMSVRYIRFERKMLNYGNENIRRFSTMGEMKKFVKGLKNRNILSTLGSNNLEEIKEMGEKNNLYIRILPTTSSIQRAEELGYLPSKIIGIQGPVDKMLNKAMIKSYKIDYLITKESGAAGGELEKIEACREEGVTVLILTRPYINYGIVYNEIEDLIKNEF